MSEDGEKRNPIAFVFLSIVVLGALFVLVVIVYNLIVSGQGEFVVKETWQNVQPGVSEGKSGLFDFWEYITNPGAANRDFDSVVDENVENSNLGIKIDEFETISPDYDEGRPIQLFARIEMAGISGSQISEEVYLNCSLEDYRGDDGVVEPDKLVYYGDGSVYVDSVLCKFPKGINVYKGKLDTKKATINATSTYTQLVNYRAYFMRDESYNSLRLLEIEPFEKYGVIYENLNPITKEVKSEMTPGPINIGIGVTKRQPFTEGIEYIPLIVNFKNDQFNGDLKEINNFRFYLSDLIELDNDPNACDFVLIEELGDVNVYGLTDYAKKIKLRELGRYEGNSLVCQFRVAESFPSDFSDLFYTVFRLEVKYDYTITKNANVKIRNLDEDQEDACGYILDEFECMTVSNCRPQYLSANFTNCVKCYYSNCEGEYSDEEKCDNNYCQFKNGCYWDISECKSYENI